MFKNTLIIISLLCAVNTYAGNAKDVEAKLLSAPPVTYPVQARAEGLEGFAVLELNVDEKGGIKSARIAQSAGNKLLDDAALEWANGIRLAPAMHNGVAVASVKNLKVNFALKDVDTDLVALNNEKDPVKHAQKLEEYSFKKLHANAAYALCGQSAYLKCYSTDYPQCANQIGKLKEDCFDKTKLQYPHADANGSLSDFSDAYFECISKSFADARKKDVEDVKQCLGNETINNDKFMSDLQR